MLWATACTCFFGFLRSGEATVPTVTSYDADVHLSVRNVAVDSQTSPTRVLVCIKTSKTDPLRQGVTVCLGKTGLELCPVAALPSSIAMRGTAPGPLFHYDSGQPLTRNALVGEICEALQAVGFNAAHYAGHNFQIEAATTAAAAGVEDGLIKILGRWQSAAYIQYIWVLRANLASVSARLAAQ
jgi:hypothetical protein